MAEVGDDDGAADDEGDIEGVGDLGVGAADLDDLAARMLAVGIRAGAEWIRIALVRDVLARPIRGSAAQRVEDSPRERLEVRIDGPEGGALRALGPGDPEVTKVDARTYHVEGPAGYPLLLRFAAEGHADTWVSAHVLQASVTITPLRLARLRIENESGHELSLEGPRVDALEALHPGLYSLFLRLSDGRGGLVSLELAPGEERILRIR